jgi:8-oxo-dGTP pyrophosphatase MutT (NUDIX family)
MSSNQSSNQYKNPWTTLASRQVYSNPWISVREDRVITPGGTEGIYGVVEPRGLAIGVLAIDSNDYLTLVGQYRYPLDCYSWEIIEGASEVGEEPLVAAKRELQEEAGLTALSWEPLGGDIHLSNSFTSEVGKLFVAQGLVEGQARPEVTEELTIKKVSLDEARSMVMGGEITDSLSVIGILLLLRRYGV